MFVEKTQAEIDAMTPEQVDAYKADLKSHQAKELQNKIDGATASKADAATVDALKSELSRISGELNAMKENGASNDKPMTLEKALKANKEQLNKILKGDTREVVVKAVTNRASIAGNTDAFKLPNIGQLGLRERSLYNIFPKITLTNGDHNGIIRYHDWDEATTIRAAAMVAEGAPFPESTAKFEQFAIPLRKIGDTLPVTYEFFEDEITAAAELEMFLNTNVDSKIDEQMAIGDNVGQNLKGLMTSAPVYTPVASGIQSANIWDLAKKMASDIVKTRGSKYRPDFVAMNQDTLDKLVLEKDQNDNYLFRDIEGIGTMAIVVDNWLPNNQMVVGDRRYGRIYELGDIRMTRGEVNEQFIEDMVTLKVRKRLLFLIRNVDATGFRKVTNITAALATLQS